MSEWISVDDRMPVANKEVRVKAHDIVAEFESTAVRYECPEYGCSMWETADGEDFLAIVTHWMPLPPQ